MLIDEYDFIFAPDDGTDAADADGGDDDDTPDTPGAAAATGRTLPNPPKMKVPSRPSLPNVVTRTGSDLAKPMAPPQSLKPKLSSARPRPDRPPPPTRPAGLTLQPSDGDQPDADNSSSTGNFVNQEGEKTMVQEREDWGCDSAVLALLLTLRFRLKIRSPTRG